MTACSKQFVVLTRELALEFIEFPSELFRFRGNKFFRVTWVVNLVQFLDKDFDE